MFKSASTLLFLLLCQLFAQNKPDYVKLEFSKPNISPVWLGNVNYNQDADKNIGLHFYDEFYTSLIIPSKVNPQWRDENRLRTFIYDQRKNVTYGLYATSWLLRDTKASAVIQSATNAVGIRSEYQFFPPLQRPPAIQANAFSLFPLAKRVQPRSV